MLSKVDRLRTGRSKLMQGAREPTGSVAGANEANVMITWPTPFADTNYSVTAGVEEDAGGESLRARRVRSKTTTGCVVNVQNTAITSMTGTVHAIAVED